MLEQTALELAAVIEAAVRAAADEPLSRIELIQPRSKFRWRKDGRAFEDDVLNPSLRLDYEAHRNTVRAIIRALDSGARNQP